MLECKPIIIGLIVGSGSPKLVKFGGGGCGGVESHAKSKYTQTPDMLPSSGIKLRMGTSW